MVTRLRSLQMQRRVGEDQRRRLHDFEELALCELGHHAKDLLRLEPLLHPAMGVTSSLNSIQEVS